MGEHGYFCDSSFGLYGGFLKRLAYGPVWAALAILTRPCGLHPSGVPSRRINPWMFLHLARDMPPEDPWQHERLTRVDHVGVGTDLIPVERVDPLDPACDLRLGSAWAESPLADGPQGVAGSDHHVISGTVGAVGNLLAVRPRGFLSAGHGGRDRQEYRPQRQSCDGRVCVSFEPCEQSVPLYLEKGRRETPRARRGACLR